MLMLVWFWAATAAFAPAQQMMAMTANALEAQRPLMTLSWIAEHDADFF